MLSAGKAALFKIIIKTIKKKLITGGAMGYISINGKHVGGILAAGRIRAFSCASGLALLGMLAFIRCGGGPAGDDELPGDDGYNTAFGYRLVTDAVPAEGGTVGRNPDNTGYSEGAHVIVTAVPNEGYEFAGWSGASASAEPYVIVAMNSDLELVANFALKEPDTGTDDEVPVDTTSLGQDLTILAGDLPIDMVFVQGGSFNMGCTEEQGDEYTCYPQEFPVHKVTLSNFYMAKYQVTQKLWVQITGSNPSGVYYEDLVTDDAPVNNVAWKEVQEFIDKLNELTGEKYRLPTEAEWEYAARGGNKSKGYKYAGSDDVDEVAWYAGNSRGISMEDELPIIKGPRPVGTKKPNELGIYDMTGNVEEWVNDWISHNGTNWTGYTEEAKVNPKGPESGTNRVIRGGSWTAPAWRISGRWGRPPVNREDGLGFRLVLDQ
jgi:formylglycine-generating enzyme required for sulfatase activity